MDPIERDDAKSEEAAGRLPKLRILWGFARPHRGRLALGLLLALAGSAAGLATPMVTKWVLDSLGSGDSLLEPSLVLLGLLLVGSTIWWFQWVLLGSTGERIVLEVRGGIVSRLLRAKLMAIAGTPVGELVTRTTSDTVLLREAAASAVVGLINGVVLLVGTLVLMGVLDLVLLGTTVACVVLVAAIFMSLMPAIARAQERAQEHVGRLGGMLEGSLRAIRTVKAAGAEARQRDRIMAEAQESTAQAIVAVKREATAWTAGFSGVQLAIIVILGLGAWRVEEGLLEVSSLIAFLLYAFQLMEPVMELTQNVTTLQSGIAAAGRISQLDSLEVEPEGEGAATGESVASDPEGPVLELRKVSAAYGPELEPAVVEVDLVVPRRGHLAVVGPTGAGKTTLLSLMLRFLEPRSGELRLDGVPFSRLAPAEVRRRLAYVEQETPLVPGTLRDNLTFSRPDASAEEIEAILEQVLLRDRVRELPEGLDTPLLSTNLSGGERQRIALARALLRSPDVLLLDEATAQVDGMTEAAIHDCIRRCAADGAVVTVAHRLSTVLDADEIVVMDGGRVRARGSHAELLSQDELYRGLVEALRIADAPAAGLTR